MVICGAEERILYSCDKSQSLGKPLSWDWILPLHFRAHPPGVDWMARGNFSPVPPSSGSDKKVIREGKPCWKEQSLLVYFQMIDFLSFLIESKRFCSDVFCKNLIKLLEVKTQSVCFPSLSDWTPCYLSHWLITH